MADEPDVQAKIRMPAALKREIDYSAFSTKRSMNGEIVARLEKSFAMEGAIKKLEAQRAQDAQRIGELEGLIDGDGSIQALRRQIDAMLPEVELSAEDGREIVVRVVGGLREQLEERAARTNTNLPTVIRDLLGDAMTYPALLENLRKQVAKQKLDVDRTRNERFGGRAITAEIDALRREREELDRAKKERESLDKERETRVDALMARMNRVLLTMDNKDGAYVAALEPQVMDIVMHGRMLWTKLKSEPTLSAETYATCQTLARAIDILALAVAEAADTATGTTTPAAPVIQRSKK